jgi:hypothetical protein
MTKNCDLVVEPLFGVRAQVILENPTVETEVNGRPERIFDLEHGWLPLPGSVRPVPGGFQRPTCGPEEI